MPWKPDPALGQRRLLTCLHDALQPYLMPALQLYPTSAPLAGRAVLLPRCLQGTRTTVLDTRQTVPCPDSSGHCFLLHTAAAGHSHHCAGHAQDSARPAADGQVGSADWRRAEPPDRCAFLHSAELVRGIGGRCWLAAQRTTAWVRELKPPGTFTCTCRPGSMVMIQGNHAAPCTSLTRIHMFKSTPSRPV